MSAPSLVHDVLARTGVSGRLAGTVDFELGPGVEADPAAVLAPGVSLYALDDDLGAFVFVEVDPGTDLLADPFLYAAQRRWARRVQLVPYDRAVELAAALPAPDRPGLLYSVGRCGSTLLCQALGEVSENAVTLSEPDVYTHLLAVRADGSRDPELVTLSAAATRFLGHAFAPASDRLVLKFRGWCTGLADLLAAALPDAGAVFLGRDLPGWLQSMNRLLDLTAPANVARYEEHRLAGTAPLLHGYPRERFVPLLHRTRPGSFLEDVALGWTSMVGQYRRWHDTGVVTHSLTYDALCGAPGPAVRAVAETYALTAAGFPEGSHDQVPAAFGRDSQAGSRLSGRDARNAGVADLGAADLARAAAQARRLGVDPDLPHRLPGHLLPGAPAADAG